MAKYSAVIECRNEGGMDIHCWIVEVKPTGEANTSPSPGPWPSTPSLTSSSL